MLSTWTSLKNFYVVKGESFAFLQTELGKPKRRGVLIPDGLTYGRPNATRDGGSSEGMIYCSLSLSHNNPCF